MVYEAQIEGIFIDRQFEEPVVMLKQKDGDHRVPIWIQMGEMFSLALQISGDNFKSPRPLAHDLIKTVIKNLQVRVQHARITDHHRPRLSRTIASHLPRNPSGTRRTPQRRDFDGTQI